MPRASLSLSPSLQTSQECQESQLFNPASILTTLQKGQHLLQLIHHSSLQWVRKPDTPEPLSHSAALSKAPPPTLSAPFASLTWSRETYRPPSSLTSLLRLIQITSRPITKTPLVTLNLIKLTSPKLAHSTVSNLASLLSTAKSFPVHQSKCTEDGRKHSAR